MADDRGPKRTKVDPFRPALITALEQDGHTEWAKRETSEHRMEMADVHGPRGGITGGMLQQQAKRMESAKRMKLAAAGPLGGITGEMLRQQAGKLKKVTEVSVPHAENLRIARTDEHHKSGAEFADFMERTRRDLTTIASTTAGRDIFKAIDSTKAHKVTIQDAGNTEQLKEAYRSKSGALYSAEGPLIDVPGPGASTTVSHHTQRTNWGVTPGASGAIALGHELIHAAHNTLGIRPRDVSGADIQPEERRTVGHADGRRGDYGVPTENTLRKDLSEQLYKGGGTVKSIPARTTYGGKKL